jgi:chromosome partitioning protein
MTVYTVANLKGGTGKSTTAAFLAHALGTKVLCVDADPPASLLRWSELGEWTIPVIGMPVADIHRRLPGISRDYEDVVIDTPPLEEREGIVRSALRAADVVLVPVSPSTMELDRLTPILAAVADVEPLRDDPPLVRILLNRVVASANSGPNARAVLTDAGIEVLPTSIPNLQRYALAFPQAVILPAGDPYQLAADDLVKSL